MYLYIYISIMYLDWYEFLHREYTNRKIDQIDLEPFSRKCIFKKVASHASLLQPGHHPFKHQIIQTSNTRPLRPETLKFKDWRSPWCQKCSEIFHGIPFLGINHCWINKRATGDSWWIFRANIQEASCRLQRIAVFNSPAPHMFVQHGKTENLGVRPEVEFWWIEVIIIWQNVYNDNQWYIYYIYIHYIHAIQFEHWDAPPS